MRQLPAILAVFALAWPTLAPAQDGGWSWSLLMPSITGTDPLGMVMREQAQRSGQAQPPATPQSKANRPALRFNASPQLRAQNIKRFADQRRRMDARGAREFEAALSAPDFFPKLDQELAKYGLRTDNLEDVYTLWRINTWQAAHGESGDPSQRAVNAAKAQSERAFAGSSSLMSASDAAKQEIADNLLFQAIIFGTATEQVRGQPAQQRALAQVARSVARQVGEDVDGVILTDQGFAPAGG